MRKIISSKDVVVILLVSLASLTLAATAFAGVRELPIPDIARAVPKTLVTPSSSTQPQADPYAIVAGRDGAMWFTENGFNAIGRVTRDGDFDRYSIPTPSSGASRITVGPDGALWFTEYAANQIGRVTTSGTFTEFPLPRYMSLPADIVTGPDGALWFTEAGTDRIGRITVDGRITEFALKRDATPWAITVGPDKALWFTEYDGNRIGRISVRGEVREFPVPTAAGQPSGIARGSDGALWFTESNADRVGRVTPDGRISEIPIPSAFASKDGETVPTDIAAGSDGELWIAAPTASRVLRLSAASRAFVGYDVPRANAHMALATASDGHVWFTEFDHARIGEVTPDGGTTARSARRARAAKSTRPRTRPRTRRPTARAAATHRWTVKTGMAAYVSVSQANGGANSYVLGYLLGAGLAGRTTSDCADLEDVPYIDNGTYRYGQLAPAACPSNTVGGWHSNGHCMWIQTDLPNGTASMNTGAAAGTVCAGAPSNDPNIMAGSVFESGTFSGGNGGDGDPAVFLPATCSDTNTYANYDPVNDALHDGDGTAVAGIGTPGYAPGVTAAVAHFGSRYRTANHQAVMLRDAPNAFTTWMFTRASCMAGTQLQNPTPVTGGSDSVTSSSATLRADVNPNGLATNVYFQVGPTAGYGSQTTSANIGGSSSVPIAQAISGLAPNTTYHYRVVATNAKGSSCQISTACGADQTFMTLGPPIGVSAPSIQLTGTAPGVGVTATATQGTWSGSPTSYTYQWSLCQGSSCTAVTGATSSTFVPPMDAVGRTLKVSVTASNQWGSSAQSSTATPAVAAPPGLFFVGANGQLWWQWYNAASHAWTYGQVSTLPQGVSAIGQPTVVFATDGSRNVYVRGSDNRIWQIQWSQGAWTTAALGGSGTSAVAGSPTALVEADGVTVDIYWRGADGQIWQLQHSSFGWAGPIAHGGAAAGDPVAVREAGSSAQDIYYVGINNHVYQLNFSSFGWAAPVDHGGSATGRPSVVVNPTANSQDVYYVGTDHHIHQLNYSAQYGWASPVDHGGSATGSPSAVLYSANSAQDVFFTGTDGAIWQLQYSQQFGWAGPTSHGGSATGSPSAMVGDDDQAQYVFSRNNAGALSQLQFSQQFGWTAAPLQGAAAADPAAL